MKVGIIGSGVVAQTLGAGFLKHGHEVALGTRDPAKLKDWAAKHKGAGGQVDRRKRRRSATSSCWRSPARPRSRR